MTTISIGVDLKMFCCWSPINRFDIKGCWWGEFKFTR